LWRQQIQGGQVPLGNTRPWLTVEYMAIQSSTHNLEINLVNMMQHHFCVLFIVVAISARKHFEFNKNTTGMQHAKNQPHLDWLSGGYELESRRPPERKRRAAFSCGSFTFLGLRWCNSIWEYFWDEPRMALRSCWKKTLPSAQGDGAPSPMRSAD